MNYTRCFVVVFAVLGLAGCASSPAPEVHFYLLRSDAPAAEVADLSTGPAIGLGEVRVAPYLLRDGIVVEVAPGEIREARYSRWSESLESSLRLLIADRAGRSGPLLVNASRASLDYAVDVYVEAFHATEAGELKLVARWAVEDPHEESDGQRYRFSDSLQMRAAGYPELVRGHRAMAERFADAIAESLERYAPGEG